MRFFDRQGRGRALLTVAAAVCLGLTAAGCGGNAARPAKGAASKAAFTDERNGQTYKTVKIGKLTWLAENLNYPTENGSWCYDGDESKCAEYGRLYDWKTALTVCPNGWRLPDTADWNDLAKAAGGSDEAGKKLRSKSGWPDRGYIVGDDTYGFSALPGGARNAEGAFSGALEVGRWWTATEGADCPMDYADCDAYIVGKAYSRYITLDYSNLMDNDPDQKYGYSVRCVVGESKAANIETDDISISVFGVDEEDFKKKYKSYESFIKHDEYAQRIAFVPNVRVKDFSWLDIGVMDTPDEVVYEIKGVLHTVKELTPQKPLVVSWVEVGMMSAFGYSYRDRDGKIKYFMGQAANYGGDP
ncbi:MAG: fibrobacter succinogenes major paralogous domain-containing protein, partial [Chitinispirillales bacterium]|nr:fibrobacter succinogenes major paralogous domain-containing protein [Chitinispirillales bacterium]